MSSDENLQSWTDILNAVYPLLLQLDTKLQVTGYRGDLTVLGIEEGAINGQVFSQSVLKQDQGIWTLILHKLKSSKSVGPVPLRTQRSDGQEGAVDITIVKVAGGYQMALTPYVGTLGISKKERPVTSQSREFQEADFEGLSKRLRQFARSSGVSVPEALMKLMGISGELASDDGVPSKLWGLYRILHEAATESAAKTDKNKAARENAEKDATAEKAAEEPPSDMKAHASVRKVVQSAFKKDKGETNYVTVAGESGLSEAESVKAAVYTLQKAAAKGSARTMQGLTGEYEDKLEKTKAQIKTFKQIVVAERFDAALQPIVDMNTGALHHFEALARFDQNVKVSPFEFMCFAEDIGIINEFDLAMTMKIISLIKRMRRIGYDLEVAVNLSGRSLQSQAFLRQFFRLLEDCGDIRRNLLFELTESSQIDDLDTTNRILSRIREFGHKVCLDDFGAGAAGMQYLRALKVDYVKIDGIYIRKALENPDDRSFLRSMSDLCDSLGVQTVGECVETEEQREFLADIGVHYAQGWLYGKPESVDDSLHWFDT